MTVPIPAQAPRIHYVYIPADVHEEIREMDLEVPPGREVECLLDTLKDHFRRAGGDKTAAQQQAHREHLLGQVGAEAASKLSDEMMAAALNMQMVETVALLVNSPDSGHVGVNLYCDDQAQFKELRPNPRASQIADCCGRPTQIRGDAFLGRLFDNDDAFVRLDLRLLEVSSAAPWVRQAAEQAARRLRQGDRAADFMSQVAQQQRQRQQQRQKATVREVTPAEAEKEAGNAAVKAGDWAAAVARYGAALDLDPELTAAANNRALALLRLGRHEEAERDCSRVLDSEPGNVKALLRRAAARVGSGRAAEAAADLQAVLNLEPFNKEAAAELAKLAPPPPPPPPPPTVTTTPATTAGDDASSAAAAAAAAASGEAEAATAAAGDGSDASGSAAGAAAGEAVAATAGH